MDNAVIEFKCIHGECDGVVRFTILDVGHKIAVLCPVCSNEYTFNKELTQKIKKFFDLIMAVRAAEDILGSTSVAIDVGENSVQVPYRLLLTRLNTLLTLKIGNSEIIFKFRVEPLREKDKISQNLNG